MQHISDSFSKPPMLYVSNVSEYYIFDILQNLLYRSIKPAAGSEEPNDINLLPRQV